MPCDNLSELTLLSIRVKNTLPAIISRATAATWQMELLE